MREKVVSALVKAGLQRKEASGLVETPPNPAMGDYAFPCFQFSRKLKKNPAEIAKDFASRIKSRDFEKVEAKGPYVNFFVDRKKLTEKTLGSILEEKGRYGHKRKVKKNIVVEFSSPNIAKPFHVGHLRSTIIGNSISNIAESQGYKAVRMNFLGDWGTQFGKLIVGFKKFGSEKKLKEDSTKHLLEIYVKANKEDYEDEAREWFKRLEDGNSEARKFWKKFRDLSLKKFDSIYKSLGVTFDVISGESFYEKDMEKVVKELEKKNLLELDEGAWVVKLEKYGLGVSLIKKSDGATLYVTRDLAAALDRWKKYKFEQMVYEVGSEQNLHFKQLFKILDLMGYSWAGKCAHVDHGLYLDKDGKKFATRKGKAVFMEDILEETTQLAKKEMEKRGRMGRKVLEERALKIAVASIIYGDLKNYRGNNIVFDLDRFVSFEGDTGPYLLYSYARAKSVLRKAKYKKSKFNPEVISDDEKLLVGEMAKFPETAEAAFSHLSPHVIANYAYELAKKFNEFYHENRVIGSENERFRLVLVDCFSQVLKNALDLLGIKTLEEM